MPVSFVWTVGSVASGQDFVVDVTSAPCSPVTLRFYVNGVEIDRDTVVPPGACTFRCPSNSTGQTWIVVAECPAASEAKNGTVA